MQKIFSYLPFNYLFATLINHNFREIVPGKLYRSGIMSSKSLERVLRKHKIASVLDLRLGASMQTVDKKSEVHLCNSLGVDYYSAPTSSRSPSHHARLLKLIKIIKCARTPLLIHCDNGCHRTGFASALWMIEHDYATKKEASMQLSPSFGYFRIERKWISYCKQDKLLDDVVLEYLNKKDSISFTKWVSNKNETINTIDERTYMVFLANKNSPDLITSRPIS